MNYDVYWVKNVQKKMADFEHPTIRGEADAWNIDDSIINRAEKMRILNTLPFRAHYQRYSLSL